MRPFPHAFTIEPYYLGFKTLNPTFIHSLMHSLIQPLDHSAGQPNEPFNVLLLLHSCAWQFTRPFAHLVTGSLVHLSR